MKKKSFHKKKSKFQLEQYAAISMQNVIFESFEQKKKNERRTRLAPDVKYAVVLLPSRT